MKKLISVLGVIGLVASSATTVIACNGDKGNNVIPDDGDYGFDQVTNNMISSAKNLSSMMLMGKTENYGNNISDILSGSPMTATSTPGFNLLERFKSSDQYANDSFASKKGEAYNNFVDAFHSNLDSGGQLDSSKGISSYISESQLEKHDSVDSETPVDYVNGYGKLSYLLSDKESSLYNTGKTYTDKFNVNVQTMSDDENSFSSKVENSVSAAEMANGISGIFMHPSAEKVQLFTTTMSQVAPIVLTNANAKKGDGKVAGMLGRLYTGMKYDNKKGKYDTTASTPDLAGDNVGVITSIYEKAWSYAANNQDNMNKLKSEMGEKLFTYVFGDNFDASSKSNTLIDKRDESYGNDEAGAAAFFKLWDNIDSNGVGAINSSNNGLYGKLINAIGQLKYHDKKFTAEQKEQLLTGDAGTYSSYNFTLLDKDVSTVLELSHQIYTITNLTLSQETMSEISKFLMEDFSGYMSLMKFLGININYENHEFELFDLFNKILFSFLDFEQEGEFTKDSDPETYFSLENYKLTPINELIQASKNYQTSDADSDYFQSAANNEYSKAVAKALGVVDNEFANEGPYKKISDLLQQDKYKSLFDQGNGEEVSGALQFLSDTYDKNILDGYEWKAENATVKFNDDYSIDQIEFDLNYDGLGNQNVTNFKTTEEVLNMSRSDIYNNLNETSKTYTDQKEHTFKNNYNGSGLYSDLTEVKHSYHIVWKNESTQSEFVDLKLLDVNNIKGFADPDGDGNYEWLPMQI